MNDEGLPEGKTYVDRKKTEALNLQKFDHPHILKLVDCYVWKKSFYIILELANGTLSDQINT